jgi:hypothetical protein
MRMARARDGGTKHATPDGDGTYEVLMNIRSPSRSTFGFCWRHAELRSAICQPAAPAFTWPPIPEQSGDSRAG